MLSNEQHRALAMLANGSPHGCTEAIMAVHFTVELLARLVRQRGHGNHSDAGGCAHVAVTSEKLAAV